MDKALEERLKKCKDGDHNMETELVRFEKNAIELHAEWCTVCGSIIVIKFIGGEKDPGTMRTPALTDAMFKQL